MLLLLKVFFILKIFVILKLFIKKPKSEIDFKTKFFEIYKTFILEKFNKKESFLIYI